MSYETDETRPPDVNGAASVLRRRELTELDALHCLHHHLFHLRQGHRRAYHSCRREIAAVHWLQAAYWHHVCRPHRRCHRSLKSLPTHLPAFEGSLGFSLRQIWINENLPTNSFIVRSVELLSSRQQICCCISIIQTDQ